MSACDEHIPELATCAAAFTHCWPTVPSRLSWTRVTPWPFGPKSWQLQFEREAARLLFNALAIVTNVVKNRKL